MKKAISGLVVSGMFALMLASGCGLGASGDEGSLGGGSPSTGYPSPSFPSSYISGKVSGAVSASVTVNLTGARTEVTTTDLYGYYGFTNLANGSYTITPSLAGYTFNPTSIAVTINNTNTAVIEKNFVAAGAYSISGTVYGAVSAGVTVNLTGASTATTTTDG